MKNQKRHERAKKAARGKEPAVARISVPLNSQIQFAVSEVLASTCQGLALLGSYSWPPHGKQSGSSRKNYLSTEKVPHHKKLGTR
jgi:hypothetical protein